MKNRALNFVIIAFSAIGLLKLADYLDQHIKSEAVQTERSIATNAGWCKKMEKPTRDKVGGENSSKS